MHLLLSLITKDQMVHMPYLHGLGLTPHVLAFAAAIALFATMLFSLTPILRLSLLRPAGRPQRRRPRLGRNFVARASAANLVVLELAIAVVLLVGAGLLGKSFYRLLHVDIGLRARPSRNPTGRRCPTTTYAKDAQVVAARKADPRPHRGPARRQLRRHHQACCPSAATATPTGSASSASPYHGEHNEVNERDVSSGLLHHAAGEADPRPLLHRSRRRVQASGRHHQPGARQAILPRRRPHRQEDRRHRSLAEVHQGDRRHRGRHARKARSIPRFWPAVYYPFEPEPRHRSSMSSFAPRRHEKSLLPYADRPPFISIDPGIGTIGEIDYASTDPRFADGLLCTAPPRGWSEASPRLPCCWASSASTASSPTR